MGFKIQESKQVEQIRVKIDVEREMYGNIDNIMIENGNITNIIEKQEKISRLVQGDKW